MNSLAICKKLESGLREHDFLFTRFKNENEGNKETTCGFSEIDFTTRGIHRDHRPEWELINFANLDITAMFNIVLFGS